MYTHTTDLEDTEKCVTEAKRTEGITKHGVKVTNAFEKSAVFRIS